MKNLSRVSLALLFCVGLCLSLLPVARAEVVASGDCGDNIAWALDDQGTLTISGSGDIVTTNESEPWNAFPWRSIAESVQTVVIEEGVTGIGDYAFYYLEQMTSMTLPSTLTSISDQGIYSCNALKDIWVNAGNPNYADIDGVLFDKSKTKLVKCPEGRTGTYAIPTGVTSIGDRAFINSCVTGVTIPPTVTDIGWSAFCNCGDLTGIEMPDSVTSIGQEAFWFCSAMTSVKLSKNLQSISDYAFENCSELKEITISEKATYIGFNAFEGCTKLTSVTVPIGMKAILDSAFADCPALSKVYFGGTELSWNAMQIDGDNEALTNAEVIFCFEGASGTWGDLTWNLDVDGVLTISGSGEIVRTDASDPSNDSPWKLYVDIIQTVVIEEGVTGIGKYAFYSMNQLTSLTLSSTVSSIDDDGIISCPAVNEIRVNAENPNYSDIDGVLYDKSGETIVRYPEGRTGTYVIPTGVTTIGNFAFLFDRLTGVTIPPTVTQIGWSAFRDCIFLTGIEMPNSVTSIGFEAFRRCISMTSIKLSKNLQSIPSYAFKECAELTEITISEKATYISNSAFQGCTKLRSITVPIRVRRILEDAFADCPALSNVYFKGTELSWDAMEINDEGNDAFTNAEFTFCFEGASGTWGDLTWKLDVNGVLTISGSGEMDSFRIYSPRGTYSLFLREWHDFSAEIRQAVIERGITTVGENAFDSCRNLSKVTIPDTVTEIKTHAFCNCTSLKSIAIPEGVMDIDLSAFTSCKGLESIALPTSIENILAYSFNKCDKLSAVYYGGTAEQWEGIMLDDYYNESLISATIHYLGDAVPDLVLPASLTSVGADAFAGGAYTYVKLPEQAVEIGPRAFADCPNLVYVYIPETVTQIDPDAFGEHRGFAILGKRGSRAETYAAEQGILFFAR